MINKSLFAAAAIATSLVALVPATQAEAKTNIDFNIGIGVGGFYPGGGYGDGGYYPVSDDYEDYDGISCNQGRKTVKWAGFHNVQAYDCSAPVYGYKAQKNGHVFKVKVNFHGDIISVKKVW
jgi:hypothetical protein